VADGDATRPLAGRVALVDHLDPAQVADLVGRIDREHGELHVLVDDIRGATTMEWGATVWESTLDVGLGMLRLGAETHAVTAHHALPCSSAGPAGSSSRSPTAPPSTTRRPTGLLLLRPGQGGQPVTSPAVDHGQDLAGHDLGLGERDEVARPVGQHVPPPGRGRGPGPVGGD